MRRDYSDKTLKYEVRRLEDLTQKIIPHFEKYPLLSFKRNDFEIFKKVCRLMGKEKHRKLSGFKKIVQIAFRMNPGGKRKYTQRDILDSLR